MTRSVLKGILKRDFGRNWKRTMTARDVTRFFAFFSAACKAKRPLKPPLTWTGSVDPPPEIGSGGFAKHKI